MCITQLQGFLEMPVKLFNGIYLCLSVALLRSKKPCACCQVEHQKNLRFGTFVA